MLNIVKSYIRGLIILLESIHIFVFSNNPKRSSKENIIIEGGLYNKGDQAMVFTAINEIKKRFPDKKIYLFSTRLFEKEKGKNTYKFDILPWDFNIKLSLLGQISGSLRKNKQHDYLKNKIKKVVENSAFFIDISGYKLSSQFLPYFSLDYLLNIVIARKYLVSYYILLTKLRYPHMPYLIQLTNYYILKFS